MADDERSLPENPEGKYELAPTSVPFGAWREHHPRRVIGLSWDTLVGDAVLERHGKKCSGCGKRMLTGPKRVSPMLVTPMWAWRVNLEKGQLSLVGALVLCPDCATVHGPARVPFGKDRKYAGHFAKQRGLTTEVAFGMMRVAATKRAALSSLTWSADLSKLGDLL